MVRSCKSGFLNPIFTQQAITDSLNQLNLRSIRAADVANEVYVAHEHPTKVKLYGRHKVLLAWNSQYNDVLHGAGLRWL